MLRESIGEFYMEFSHCLGIEQLNGLQIGKESNNNWENRKK